MKKQLLIFLFFCLNFSFGQTLTLKEKASAESFYLYSDKNIPRLLLGEYLERLATADTCHMACGAEIKVKMRNEYGFLFVVSYEDSKRYYTCNYKNGEGEFIDKAILWQNDDEDGIGRSDDIGTGIDWGF